MSYAASCGSCTFQSASSPARSRSGGSRTRMCISSHRGHLHCFAFLFNFLFEQVQKPRSIIVGCPKLAQLTTQVDQHFENRGFEFHEAIKPREIIHDAANSFAVIWHGVSSWW